MSEGKYKNILLVGASGDIGRSILSALLADSSFNVTVLSRTDSSATFPSNVRIIKADYSNEASLIKALTGHDVVISAVGGEGLLFNFDHTLLNAAVKSGVKWFIPSEYGFDLDHPSAKRVPVNKPPLDNIRLLEQHQSEMSYTLVSTGAFLDWGFENGFLFFDIPTHTVTLCDQGKHLISGTLLKNLGKAIVAILHHPELTLNKRIYIADVTFTQNEALALFEKYTNSKWTVHHASTEDMLVKAAEDWEKKNFKEAYYGFIQGLAYNWEGACHFEEKVNNGSLGLERVPLEQIVKDVVERKTEKN